MLFKLDWKKLLKVKLLKSIFVILFDTVKESFLNYDSNSIK